MSAPLSVGSLIETPAIPAALEEVPTALKGLPNWVVWRLETVNGRLTKVPHVAGTNWTRHASSTDSTTWTDFKTAANGAVLSDSQGVGFVIHGVAIEQQLVGFDLDGCRNPATGELKPWAQKLVDLLDSYTEITPSKTGVRIWIRGNLPTGTRVFNLSPKFGYGDKVKIEIYDSARYFTVTGEVLDPDPIFTTPGVAERDLSKAYETCRSIQRECGEEKQTAQTTESESKPGVQIEQTGTVLTTKRELLMHGNILSKSPFVVSDDHGNSVQYPSQSEADLGLCTALAIDGLDAEQIDEQFRQSVLCGSDRLAKWERLGQTTIAKAIKTAERIGTTVPSSMASAPAPAPVAALTAAVAPVVNTGIPGDMPEAVLEGRLGEICQKRLLNGQRFPIAYAWPALIAAAGTMVPITPRIPCVITANDPMTNFFTGLIGPVHSGKSQAINWANGVIGLPREIYSEVRAGSSEALLRKLNRMQEKNVLKNSIFIDLDEWKHLFDKAGIEHASFTSFLQTAFYKRKQNVVLGRGVEIDLDCAMTLIGGIVQDAFEDCFGAKSMGGLHDRFTFGLCPEGYNFLYRPFEGLPEETNPIAVQIDR